jgi:hypothetical protein
MKGRSVAHLDNEQWDDQLHDLLKHWRRPERLGQNALLGLRVVAERAKDGQSPAAALRGVAESAITRLAPDPAALPNLADPDDPRWAAEAWRYYNILRAHTWRQPPLGPEETQVLMGLSKTHYYREYRIARMMLAEELRQMEGMPLGPDDAPWQLEYPSGGMRADDPFYIERAADREMALELGRAGQTITIRGSRQVGKTSLLARGVAQAQAQFGAQLVYLDFQSVGQGARSSLYELCRALSHRVFKTLGLDMAVWREAWTDDYLPQDNLEGLMAHALQQAERPILLAMDEVDVLQTTPFSRDFFGLLRSWHNLRAGDVLWRRLTLMMAISTEPYLLIDHVGESPFNTGKVIYLNDFSAAQAAELNRRYRSPLTESETAALYRLLNGHPYLTRVALYTLVTAPMGWSELEQTAADEDGPFHQHLRWQLSRLEDDPRLMAAMADVVHNQCCADPKVAFHLEKAGLVLKAGDNYVCRCELYRRYFADRLDVRIAA